MFRPIKNFITYIQKNASGSTFFGGTSSNAELNDSIMESELVDTNSNIDPAPLRELAAPVSDKNHDQNENEVLEDSSVVDSTADDPLMINEEEEEKDIFLDFPPATESEDNDVDFPTSEVVVLDDPDLNTSITSDPGTDPLAIDDCNGHLLVNSSNLLDSSGDGDVVYMIEVHKIDNEILQMKDESEGESSRVLATEKSVDEQEIRSDGSDSGLGSETSTLQSTIASVVDTSGCSTGSPPVSVTKIPMRSNLKRRLQSVDENQHVQKKPRRSINFEGVKVFYFPRIQGYGCVPSQGGCTLGMAAHHVSFKTFSLAEHAAELRRAHKLQLQEINPRGSSSEESDSDEEISEASGSDLDTETNGFLQPVSPKQRRALLKAAGVRKIDPNEKIECRDIRNSREVCGCVCREFCDPDTCACSQAGIKCQVDRAMFPCGCNRDACGNVIGRIEFNPARVRTHFIHTIMRLEMEKRQQKRSEELASQLTASASHMAYNNVPAMDNSTTSIQCYNTIPSYGLEQNATSVALGYHHHQLHQQHNAYMNHIPPTHPAGNVYANLSNAMVMESQTATLPLPQPHNHYVNTTATEPDSISSSLAMNGGNLHYQDGSIYSPVQPPLQPPPATAYGDILAPYATSVPYHTAQVVESNYSPNVYNSYHNLHHLHTHLQQQPPQHQFLGYPTSNGGDMTDYNESQSSFINLNDASSSRLSAINDLLHNNRNTTAALVAVSEEAPGEPLIAMQESILYPSNESATIDAKIEEENDEKNVPDIKGEQENDGKAKEEIEQKPVKIKEDSEPAEIPAAVEKNEEECDDKVNEEAKLKESGSEKDEQAEDEVKATEEEEKPETCQLVLIGPSALLIEVTTSNKTESEEESPTPEESSSSNSLYNDGTCSSEKAEVNPINTANGSPKSVLKGDPSATTTIATEEERITDNLPPIVEIVSA